MAGLVTVGGEARALSPDGDTPDVWLCGEPGHPDMEYALVDASHPDSRHPLPGFAYLEDAAQLRFSCDNHACVAIYVASDGYEVVRFTRGNAQLSP